MKKITAPWVQGQKGKQKIVCVTAYDAPSAQLADLAEIDVVLVGDSMGNVVLGFEDTIPVTLDMIAHHTAAVRRGLRRALLIADMPLGSYGASVSQAVESACRLVKSGAEAVKLEGRHPEAIEAITRIGIPVMGHLGMTPQSKNAFGGFKPQGRTEKEAEDLVQSLKEIEEAGVFATVLELVPGNSAARLTKGSGCPTIGIGSGQDCDGEIQVWHDILGLSEGPFKHSRRFAEAGSLIQAALQEYASSVRDGSFPALENTILS